MIDPEKQPYPPLVFDDSGDLLSLDKWLASLAERETRGATIREAFTEAAKWVREISESYNIAYTAVSDIAEGEGAPAEDLVKMAKDALATSLGDT